MKYEDNAVDIEGLLRDFSINKKEFISFSDYYNDKFSEYGNEVYDDFKVRLVHLKYFLEDSWWNDRFYFLWKYFKKYGQIIDIGFSVPYLPIHLYRLGRIDELPNILYVDGNETSKILAEKICEKIGIEVDFVVGDVQMSATWEMIRDRIKSDSKLFCLFETIEHLTVADDFWKNIHAYKGSDIILSLPIGPKIPSHQISFDNEAEVVGYLSRHIDIIEGKVFSGQQHGSKFSIYTAYGRIA